MMTKSHVLIVTAPGSLQNGLLALMTAMPKTEVVGEAGDASAALEMVVEYRPHLVLLDAALTANDRWELLRQIKNARPATRCIALVDDVPQQQQARAGGADIALVKGFPPAKLIATIEGLLQVRERARSKGAAEHGQEGEVLP
jgi:DNA-binding NarL/FixJ family response regulator